MERHASTTAYTAGIGTGFFGSMTLNDAALLVGIVCTLGTFILNWYYKARDDKRRDRRSTDV